MAKLAKRTVDALKPREKAYVAYDSELHGFGVRVMPSGHKSFIVEYRPHGGGRGVATRRLTVGTLGALTPTRPGGHRLLPGLQPTALTGPGYACRQLTFLPQVLASPAVSSAEHAVIGGKDASVSSGGQKADSCPEGQVRDANGSCGCPPYLDAVTDAVKGICCQKPCGPGMKRVNGGCVADPNLAANVRACPSGWSGTYPLCCAPGSTFKDGRGWCRSHTSTIPCERKPLKNSCRGGMVGTPPNCDACPENSRFWHGRCVEMRCPRVHPRGCQAAFRYVNGRCVPPLPKECPRGMVGNRPNCACPANSRFWHGRCVKMRSPKGVGGIWYKQRKRSIPERHYGS